MSFHVFLHQSATKVTLNPSLACSDTKIINAELQNHSYAVVLLFVIFNKNIYCGYSRVLSRCDGSSEHYTPTFRTYSQF